MLVNPSSSSTPPLTERQSRQSSTLGGRDILLRSLDVDLTIGNQILLRVLLCSLSFVVGISYSSRLQPPTEQSKDAVAAETVAIAAASVFPTQQLAQLSPFELPPLPPEPRMTLRLKAVGDMVLGTNYPGNRLHPEPNRLLAGIAPLLQDADVVFGNFESTLTQHTIPSKDTRRPNVFAFRTPPSYNQLLQAAGFTVLNIANNHALDFGQQGFVETGAAIEQAGMQVVGRKGEITYTTLDELEMTVAWIGFSYSGQLNAMQALQSARSLVKAAQANADMVFISVHAGAEGTGALRTRNQTEYFFGENRGNLVEFSRALVNEGADLVLGHGPHVPRALELYQGKLIAYSLGNFVGYRTLSTQAQLGDSLVLELEFDSEGDLLVGKIHPVRLDRAGIPAPTANPATINLMRQLTQSDFPQTPLTIDPDGMIIPQVE
ncbi:MAG: CapA family protein [Cyanobacteria bacterium P01_G01_bin.54]